MCTPSDTHRQSDCRLSKLYQSHFCGSWSQNTFLLRLFCGRRQLPCCALVTPPPRYLVPDPIPPGTWECLRRGWRQRSADWWRREVVAEVVEWLAGRQRWLAPPVVLTYDLRSTDHPPSHRAACLSNHPVVQTLIYTARRSSRSSRTESDKNYQKYVNVA